MANPTLERAELPPREVSPQEPVEFVPWKGFPPRQVSPKKPVKFVAWKGFPARGTGVKE